jgi:hypothetical protein
MAAVALTDVDLFFRAKIEAMLNAGGHRLAAAGEPPDVIVADVNRCGDPGAVVAAAGAVPVLGFGRHTDAETLRAARTAGFARVVPRSVLAVRLGDLIAELVG